MIVNIRSAVATDVPALLAVEQQASTAAHWNSGEYAKLVNTGVVLIAETEGRTSGFICAKKVADEWEIENVVVAPDSLRRGIASQLLRDLVHRARRENAASIFLEVRESNAPARSLYQKHGFCEVGQRRGYYRDPIEDAILYALKLAE